MSRMARKGLSEEMASERKKVFRRQLAETSYIELRD